MHPNHGSQIPGSIELFSRGVFLLSIVALIGNFFLSGTTGASSAPPREITEPFYRWSLAFDGIRGVEGVQSADGNIVLAGYGDSKASILQLAPDGSTIWSKDYDTGESTFLNSIRETSDLGFIAAGRAGFGPWIMKTDSDGGVQWQKQFDADGEGEAAIETSDGDYILIGRKDNNYWVVRLDSVGDVLWQKSYSLAGDSNYESAKAIVEAEDNGFVIAGDSVTTDSVWIIKIDGSGSLVWQKQLTPGTNSARVEEMIRTADGNYVIIGRTSSTGGSFASLLKFDESGDIIWQKQMSDFNGESVAEMANGDLVLAGYADHELFVFTGYLARVDSTGNILWQRTYPYGQDIFFHSVFPAQDGDINVVGRTAGLEQFYGMLAMKVRPDGLLEDCNFIFDAAASVSTDTLVPADTSVVPVSTTVTSSAPAVIVEDTEYLLEVFCSIYSMPADDSYWAMAYGRYSDDDYDFHLHAMIPTMDNAFLAVGGYAPHDTGQEFGWVMKVGQDSSVVWQTLLGNVDDDYYSDGVIAPDNSAYLAGTTNNAGNYDGLLTKMDDNGNVLWHNSYGGSAFESFNELIRLANGDLVLLGGTAAGGAGTWDFWLVRVDPNGTLLWSYRYDRSGLDYSTALIETSNGDLVVVGLNVNSNFIPLDGWILRLDATANILWQKSFHWDDSDTFQDVIETSNQDLVVVGDTDNPNFGGKALVVRFSPTGGVVWQKAVGPGNIERASTIEQDADGNFVVAGQVQIGDFPFLDHSNGWLFKLDSAGNLVWETSIGGLGSESLYDLAVLSNGKIVAAGSSSSPGIDTGNSAKAFIAKFDPTGLVCGCLAQADVASSIGTASGAVSNTNATRQPAGSTVTDRTIELQPVLLESNAICRLIPIDGPTPTPTPTTGPPTITPTSTGSPTPTATAATATPTATTTPATDTPTPTTTSATPTPTPTSTTGPPTLTLTATQSGSNYLIYLPLVTRE